MITIKDECEHFKREARDYIYLQKIRPILDDEAQSIYDRLGIKSPRRREVIYENARDPKHDEKIDLWEAGKKKIRELVAVETRIEAIDRVFDHMSDEKINGISIKDAIFSLLVLGSSQSSMAENLGMDRSTLRRKVNREIKKAIRKSKLPHWSGVDVI